MNHKFADLLSYITVGAGILPLNEKAFNPVSFIPFLVGLLLTTIFVNILAEFITDKFKKKWNGRSAKGVY